MKIQLLEMIGYDPAIPGPGYPTSAVYISTRGYTDHVGGVFYEPCLKIPGLFSQSMYAPGTTGGASTTDYGTMVLTNNTGELDYLADWFFSGYPWTLKEGEHNAPISSFATVMCGTLEQLEFSLTTVTPRFKDKTLLFNAPVRLSVYAGNNVGADGLEGSLELKDKEKPRLLGSCPNITPVCVNASRLIYQFHDGLATSIQGVRDNGAPLTAGSAKTLAQIQAAGTTRTVTVISPPTTTLDSGITPHSFTTGDMVQVYSSGTLPAPLVTGQFWFIRYVSTYTFSLHPTAADATANTKAVSFTTAGSGAHTVEKSATTPGCYDWCFDASGSYIRLGSTPTGPVTMAATVAGTLGQAIKMLALERCSTVIDQSIIDLDSYEYPLGGDTLALSAMPWGFYTGQKNLTSRAVLDALCAIGIWWGFDNLGNFWAKQLNNSGNSPLLELGTAEILSMELVATKDDNRGVSPWRVNVRYKMNDTRQSNMAGSVYTYTPADAAYYESEFLTASVVAATVPEFQPLEAELTLGTVLQDADSALAIAQHELTSRSGRCDRLKVKVKLAALNFPDVGAWDDEAITELPVTATVVCSVVVDNYAYVIAQEATAQKAYRLNLNTADRSAWEPLTDPPTLFNDLYCSLVTDGTTLYLIGGQKIYTFNPASVSNPWVNSGVTLTPTDAHVACYYGGCIYLVGGFNGINQSSKGYKITISGWSVSDAGLTDYPAAIIYGSGIVVGTTWYVGGGRNGGASPGSLFYALNLTAPTGAWVALTALPRATQGQAFVLSLDATRILMVAGTATYPTRSAAVNSYNLATGVWSVDTAPLPQARIYCGAVIHATGIYVIGGYTGKSTVKLCSNSIPGDKAKLTSMGRSVRVTYPRYGYNSGRTMKIIGAAPDRATNKITLELWGQIL